MVQCIATFLDACYLVCRADINEDTIAELQMAIAQFHEYREIFRVHGVRPRGFSLPRQHSLIHYPHQIREFGAPAGLCSSITESRHIMAVKQPWRRCNRHGPWGPMLLTKQRLDKLNAARNDFGHRGLLPLSRTPAPKPILLCEEDEDAQPIDEYVTGTVTMARTRHMSNVLLLLEYTHFQFQRERFLATLLDWPIILKCQNSLNSHAASFMTKYILMAHPQTTSC